MSSQASKNNHLSAFYLPLFFILLISAIYSFYPGIIFSGVSIFILIIIFTARGWQRKNLSYYKYGQLRISRGKPAEYISKLLTNTLTIVTICLMIIITVTIF